MITAPVLTLRPICLSQGGELLERTSAEHGDLPSNGPKYMRIDETDLLRSLLGDLAGREEHGGGRKGCGGADEESGNGELHLDPA